MEFKQIKKSARNAEWNHCVYRRRKKLIEYLLGLYVPSRVQPIENGSRKQLYHTHTTSETKINEAASESLCEQWTGEK